MAGDNECLPCGDTISHEEAGENWLKCIEYTGPGATDPAGATLPATFMITDFIKFVKIYKDNKIVQISLEQFVRGLKVVSVEIDEDLVGALYADNPRAILFADPNGKTPASARIIDPKTGMASTKTDGFTRLEWYIFHGRDPLRTLATGRIRLGILQPIGIGMIGK
jgi:hypothetical protein